MLTPTGMAMLYRTFPPAERVRASRILTVPTALAPALGPEATGAASMMFNTGRQLGVATGVAILTTVASAVGLTQHVGAQHLASSAAPHIAAYHAALLAASVIALLAAGVAQFVNDRAAAATMRGPDPGRG